MNELFPDLRAIALWLVIAVMAILAFFGRRHLKEYDEFKKNAVTRSELQRMHVENGNKMDGITEIVTKTSDRIDQLYRDLFNRRP